MNHSHKDCLRVSYGRLRINPRNLIETLAVEIADALLGRHPLSRVVVMIEKHILPDTECVAVHVVREIRTSK